MLRILREDSHGAYPPRIVRRFLQKTRSELENVKFKEWCVELKENLYNQESTGVAGFFLALLLANQWEAKNPIFLLFYLQTIMKGQNGVEFNQESTGHVGFFLALLLADQWEAKNPNFLVIWPTDKYEGSKWLNVYCQDLV